MAFTRPKETPIPGNRVDHPLNFLPDSVKNQALTQLIRQAQTTAANAVAKTFGHGAGDMFYNEMGFALAQQGHHIARLLETGKPPAVESDKDSLKQVSLRAPQQWFDIVMAATAHEGLSLNLYIRDVLSKVRESYGPLGFIVSPAQREIAKAVGIEPVKVTTVPIPVSMIDWINEHNWRSASAVVTLALYYLSINSGRPALAAEQFIRENVPCS